MRSETTDFILKIVFVLLAVAVIYILILRHPKFRPVGFDCVSLVYHLNVFSGLRKYQLKGQLAIAEIINTIIWNFICMYHE